MRVGLFSNAYHPIISGVVNSVEGIRRGLLELGHQPYLFAPEVRGYRDPDPSVFRFASVELPRRVPYPIPIPYSGRLFRLIKNLELDIIHAHHPFLLGEVAASFARRKQIPLVYTFHTQVEQYSHYVPFNQQMVKGMARSRIRRYLNKCDLVIAPSAGVRELLDTYRARTRVVTLNNAIETDRFFASDCGRNWRQELAIPPEALISLSVGRLAKEKNLTFLLEAFARLAGQDPRQYLVVVGDGHEREHLMALVERLELQERVRFTGELCYDDMPSIYQSCDLFVISSKTEVKPLVVLEALASGLPVLAVAACGTADTIEHEKDGWLCSDDLKSYLQGWTLLTQDTALRNRLSHQARITAHQYSFSSYLERLCELYRDCISNHRAGPLTGVRGAG